MEIPLNLGRHCIETAARIALEQGIRAALKSPDEENEARITALTHFLQTADFQALRSQINGLQGPPACILQFKEDRLEQICLGEHILPPILKK